ncbi:AAA family ATPase [Alkalimarinus alittae]|uniref:AAA family ATPase n=1 Tax=Alkalimarinus alittae TaxID=2961619 RepID=A0ABY6MYB0_9ALTE|nr:AAA family ATPase [Alkalimarinus alittae]UZE94795.1 AAA family ATPase [Alkalimarinus alittae]
MANKPYRRGLVVGKFSPFHKGHEYLLNVAAQHCSEVLVISYSRPEFPSCSAAVRASWLKQFAPNARVLSVNAATVERWRSEEGWPLEMPLNSDDDESHREFTYKLIAEKLKLDIDVVLTSEDYGDGFARYLSHHEKGFGHTVQHVCVDRHRLIVPVSGTAVRRSNTLAERKVNSTVWADFKVQKICFLGAESTGKTTLSKLLAEAYDDPVVDEYGRTLWELNNGVLTPEDLVKIGQTQTENEDKAQQLARNYIFCDTSPLTTLCYSDALFNDRPRILEAFAEQPYHHTFLCEPDFPLVQDGTRKDEAFRAWQHGWYLKVLRQRKIPYTALKGPLSKRVQMVKKCIEQGALKFCSSAIIS